MNKSATKTFEDYLEENSKYPKPLIDLFLRVVGIYEKYYKKIFYKFDIDMIQAVVETMIPASKREARIICNMVREYLKWSQLDIPKTQRKVISVNDLTKSIRIAPYLPKEDKTLSENKLLKQADLLEDPLDKIILLCPYYGINGAGMSELIGLKKKDIRKDLGGVSVQKKNIADKEIIIPLPKQLINWLEECAGDDSNIIQEGIDTGRQKEYMDTRLININKKLKTSYSYATLRRHGFLNACKKNIDKEKIDFKNFLDTQIGAGIMEIYGFPRQRKSILVDKYEEYFR